ncbi:MAG: undecaprenyldiphospho-muramoylpentapeptide beta-N-acetylglucosaminyltransferase, partial [Pseudomonadota bacterium]
QMDTRVIMMAGGTGGHVFPALAVATLLRERGWSVTWMGTRNGLAYRVVPAEGFELDTLEVRGLRRSGLLRLLGAPLVLLRAGAQAWRILRRRRPHVVLGMGGFATGPGGLAARMLGIPLVVHEQNAIPGLTNRLLVRMATRVLAAFPQAFGTRPGVEVTGNPVRREIRSLEIPAERFARHDGPLRLLVMGGSLGAQVLNEQVPLAIAEMPGGERPFVRHQAGRGKADRAQAAYRDAGVTAEVSEFIEDVAQALSWADLVVCRSGALTISELAAAGVGAVLVPYPHAVDDHQTANGRFLADAHAAVLLPQAELTPGKLGEILRSMDRSRLLGMAERARALATPDAAARVADIIAEVAS